MDDLPRITFVADALTDPRERLIQLKTNTDLVMSLLDKNGLGDWLADHLAHLAEGACLPTVKGVRSSWVC